MSPAATRDQAGRAGPGHDRDEALACLPAMVLAALVAAGFEYLPRSGCFHRSFACLRLARLNQIVERSGEAFVTAFVEACAEGQSTRPAARRVSH